MTVLLFVAGLAFLILGAEGLVRGSSRLAVLLGISPLVVGLTVVAFGTSSPELAVSVKSALIFTRDGEFSPFIPGHILMRQPSEKDRHH